MKHLESVIQKNVHVQNLVSRHRMQKNKPGVIIMLCQKGNWCKHTCHAVSVCKSHGSHHNHKVHAHCTAEQVWGHMREMLGPGRRGREGRCGGLGRGGEAINQ